MMNVIRPTSMLILMATAIAFASGCDDKRETQATQAAPKPAAQAAAANAGGEPSAAVIKEAEETFAGRCTPCHGPQGKGDGPASAGLTPKPANFTDSAWQKSVTDEHIEKVIAYGGAAAGKSAAMPPNPDLADKPVIQGLRQHIRNLNK